MLEISSVFEIKALLSKPPNFSSKRGKVGKKYFLG